MDSSSSPTTDTTDPLIFPSPSDVTDLDFSFTSSASTDRTLTSSSSARTSLSLTLSFNNDSSSHPHRRSDPHWSAIRAATALSPLQLRHLKLLRHLGSGDLARVYLCRLRDAAANNLFALKVVDRDALTPKKLAHVQTESEILSMLDHPFLPTLYAHLEVSHYTCLLIDYCPRGDLHSLLRRQPGHRFGVRAVRFFASEVLVALEYLHAMGVVYRDLKPENVLIREDGHVMLSDFDLCFRADVEPRLERLPGPTVGPTEGSKQKRPRSRLCLGGWLSSSNGDGCEREETVTEFVAEPRGAYSRSCVGTHEYLAPELVNGNGHGNGVDWWAFGVLVYELMYGTTPFKGESKECTLRNIAGARALGFPGREDGADAKDLIGRLLVREEGRRLGCARGAAEVKRHPFFKGVKWPLIRMQRVPEEVVSGGVKKMSSHVGSFGRELGVKGGFGNLVKWSGNLCRSSSSNDIKGKKWV